MAASGMVWTQPFFPIYIIGHWPMNDVDLIILFIVGIGTCIGLYRGFFREAVSTIGLLLAAIAANYVSPYARPHVGQWIESETVSAIVIWVVIFLLSMFVLKKLAYLLSRLMRSMELSWVNRMAGGLFGGIKYSLIVALAVSVIEVACAHVEGLKIQPYIENSVIIPWLHQLVDVVTPWASQHILGPALEMLK